MKNLCLAALAIASVTCPGAASAQAAGTRPVVVELFTSQSCSSCPPAEAYLRELTKRPDLIALEWHVDYWDDLDVARAGRWKDPFSSAANTERQRIYNQHILHKSGVYTPQAVIGGATEATGFDREGITRRIQLAASSRPGPPADVRIAATKSQDIRFKIDGAPANADIMLVTFRRTASTRVGGGENHGKVLANANVVTAVRRLGQGTSFSTPRPADDEGCALLVAEENQGRILGGAYCPS